MATTKHERLTTITLLGSNEEKKYFVGTAILSNTNAFLGKLNKTSKPTCLLSPSPNPTLTSPSENILFVYTPACTKKDKDGGISIKPIVKYLCKKVRFVNGFILVLNANELEVRNYDLILAFVKVYGTAFLHNLVVAVTGASSSFSASTSFSSLPATTSAELVQAWLDNLYPLLPPSSSQTHASFFIPFMFIHHCEDDSKDAFKQGREIMQLIREYPAIGCFKNHDSPSSKLNEKYQKKAKERGLHQCKKCSRFFRPRTQLTLAALENTESQVAIAMARASSAAHLTLASLKMDSLEKLVTEAEGVIAGGMGLFRTTIAAGAVEKAQEAVSKEASKIGAKVGAFAGGFVCTLVLPGAGTSIGQIVGGKVGSRSAKRIVDSCFDLVLGQNLCGPCHKLKKSSKIAKKAK